MEHKGNVTGARNGKEGYIRSKGGENLVKMMNMSRYDVESLHKEDKVQEKAVDTCQSDNYSQ